MISGCRYACLFRYSPFKKKLHSAFYRETGMNCLFITGNKKNTGPRKGKTQVFDFLFTFLTQIDDSRSFMLGGGGAARPPQHLWSSLGYLEWLQGGFSGHIIMAHDSWGPPPTAPGGWDPGSNNLTWGMIMRGKDKYRGIGYHL
jgi:hypothetical protein